MGPIAWLLVAVPWLEEWVFSDACVEVQGSVTSLKIVYPWANEHACSPEEGVKNKDTRSCSPWFEGREGVIPVGRSEASSVDTKGGTKCM